MINVDQITARLAKLPDQALQQYAAMHKNDPYIMALAVSESNRRKQMRQAAQAPQGGEEPKVVDQELAMMGAPQQMLPEDQGIAQLPAGDMNFAGGGIVAFADGGDVERYQSQGLVQPQQRPGESWADFRARAFKEQLAAEQAKRQQEEARRQQEYAVSEAARLRALAERGGTAIPPSPYGVARPPVVPVGVTPVAPAAPSKTDPNFRRQPDPRFTGTLPPIAAQVAGSNAPPPPAPDVEKKPPPTGQRPPAPAPAAPAAPVAPAAPAAPTAQGLADIFKSSITAATREANPFAAQEAALTEAGETAAQERLTRLKEDLGKEPAAYKAREERFNAKAAELIKSKDTNTGLAFLEAGLAIMSTPGSLGTAIGKGARVGTEKYTAGLEKLRQAQERLEEARDKLEDLRINRSDMNAKEIRAAEADYDNTVLQGKKDVLAAAKTWYGNQRVLGTKIAELGVTTQESAKDRALREWQTRFEQAEQTKRAGIAAAAPSAQELMFRTLGGGDLAAGIQKYTALTGEGKTENALVAYYAKDPAALKLLEATNPTMAAQIKQQIAGMLIPAPVTTPSGNARP